MTFTPSFLTETQAGKVLRSPRLRKDVVFLPKGAAKDLAIDWAVVNGENGRAVVAVCEGAICWIGATDIGEAHTMSAFRQFFAQATLREKELPVMKKALRRNPPQIPLLLFGTPFQHSVWRLLLRIPRGVLVRYADLARALNRPRAARAVGNAVGANPVAWLVPCHRVGHSDGGIRGFAFGEACKRRWLKIEAAA